MVAIASRLDKSPAQILLKWIIKRGVAAIPKSTNANRLRENISLFDFDLTDEDMETIKKLDKGIRIVSFEFFQGWAAFKWVKFIKNFIDQTVFRVEKHPEFPF